MITDVRLSNFKSFGEKENDIALGKINILIGENGTGKSSFIQALALLHQSIGNNGLTTGRYKFSSYGALVHNSFTKNNISIGISGKASVDAVDKNTQDEIPFEYGMTFTDPSTLLMQKSSIKLPDDLRQRLSIDAYEIKGLLSYGDTKVSPDRIGQDDNNVGLTASTEIGRPLRISGGQGTHGQSNQHKLLIDEVESFLSVFSVVLKNIYIDYALRGFDSESYPLSEAASESPVTGGEVFSTFAYRREIEEKVSNWLSMITDTGLSIHLVPKKQIELKSSEGYDIYQGGFGSNQLIRPLLQLAISPADSVIAIEEADISLHPKAQIKLCEVLASIALKENKQLILTSHSETMLIGFLNLVAEGKIAPQDLRIYYFEKNKGNTCTSELKIDNRGAIEGGLKGFSEVNLDNYKRHMDALSRRTK
ncbi:MAG: AAA family ATPase [Dehalococcoidales bacterium]|nr:AAA family ATPase [Dehalococcoidales bacterium]